MARAIDKDEAMYQLERLALEAQMVDECEENTIRRCIAAVKLVPTFTPPNEWVSVEERLPEEKEMCLLYTPRDGIMCVGFYAGNDNWEHKHKWKLVTAMRSSQTLTKKVTHWMPIPAPPDRRSPEGKT